MTERLRITVKAPRSCIAAEIQAFEKLVVAGGEVDSYGLRARVDQAKALVFVHSSGQLVGSRALNLPHADYRKCLFQKSRTHLPARFPLELGWIYVVPAQRGTGASRRIVEAFLKRVDRPARPTHGVCIMCRFPQYAYLSFRSVAC